MIHVDERGHEWVYSATAAVGLLVALFLPASRRFVPERSRRAYAVLQALTLLGAIIGAKLAFLAGDLAWPVRHVTFDEVVFSGKSITGGLLGGFLLAEAGKIAIRYAELPNDWFATKLPLSIAIGRVGCVVAGCCRGVPGSFPFAFVYSDGIPRFPAQACELAFQILAFAAALVVFRRGLLRGRVFSAYMIGYGAFRFGVEALRETPKLVGALSVYQLLAAALVVCGVTSFAWYSRVVASRAREGEGGDSPDQVGATPSSR
jgi:phosphatidylglycerol:prolipoprotein diacylglycerol transferase